MNCYAPRSLLSALLVGFALPAMLWATPIFDPVISTCATPNCDAVRIDGTVENRPWIIEIYANAQQCLRAHVTAEGADLEAVLIAPNGTVYRNDDSGLSPCANCPLIKVNPTPNTSWYTLNINHFAGTAVTANFTLMYARYNLGNANCANPTPSLAPEEEAESEEDKPETESHGVLPSEGPGQ
jgi:hypothetical protein